MQKEHGTCQGTCQGQDKGEKIRRKGFRNHSYSCLLMALGKILLGRWTADIYLEDCLKIRSTGVDNEDCA